MSKKYLAGILVLAVMVGIAFNSCRARAEEVIGQKITPEVAGRFALYAMMASNAYHDNKRYHFAIDKLGWHLVDLKGNKTNSPSYSKETFERTSGLSFDVFAKDGTNDIVIAFRGTDSKWDYVKANFAILPIGNQYKKARKIIGEFIANNPDKSIIYTGHSLGGGLALGMSVRVPTPQPGKGFDAVVFDSSPRIFDGLGDRHLAATRIGIHEKGEILEIPRKLIKKYNEVIPPENRHITEFGFAKRHSGHLLARGLLELGVTSNPELRPVLEELNKELFGKP